MYNLLQSDLMKMRKSLAFRLLILAVTLLSVVTSLSSMSYVGSPRAEELEIVFSGHDAFFVSLRDAPTLILLCVILVGLLVCSDFDNRTLQASIYAGHSRFAIMASKCIVLLLGIAVTFLPYPLVRAVLQGVAIQFGPALSLSVVLHMLVSYLTVVLVFFALACLSVLLAFAIRKTVVVMVASIVLLLLGTNALLSFGVSIPALGNILDKTPIGLSRSLYFAGYAPGMLLQAAGISLLSIFVLLGITYAVFRHAELK